MVAGDVARPPGVARQLPKHHPAYGVHLLQAVRAQLQAEVSVCLHGLGRGQVELQVQGRDKSQSAKEGHAVMATDKRHFATIILH